MATSAVISDDWEEVNGGDDFSVVSAPTTEDLDDDSQGDSQEWVVSAGASTKTAMSQKGQHGGNASPTVRPMHPEHNEVHEKKGQDDEVERLGMDTKDVTETEEPSSQDQLLDLNNIDPGSLDKVNLSLIELVVEIIGLVDSENTFQQTEIGKIRTECQTILAHSRCLCPILEGYAKHWDPERASGEFPLDPGLESWMAKLTYVLRDLKRELQTAVNQKASNADKGPYLHDAVGFEKALANFVNQMDGFIPVIQK